MSKKKSSSSSSSGIGFVGLLTIVFITLKLLEITQVAQWSWWWVLSPIWISAIAFIVIIVVWFLIMYTIERMYD